MQASWLLFVGVSLVVICTPGPDTVLTLRNTLSGGRRRGLWTAGGVASGQFVWTIATSLGLAAVIIASRPLFEALRLVGAAYLIGLGVWSLWRAASGAPGATAATQQPVGRSGFTAFGQGLANDLANPKMAAFFLSLLPQFAPPGDPLLSVLLGAIFCGLTFAWLSAYAIVAHRARRALSGRRSRRILEALSGSVLVALGVRIAVE